MSTGMQTDLVLSELESHSRNDKEINVLVVFILII